MIVTSVIIPRFEPDESKLVIEALGKLQSELKSVAPPGYQRTLLLREDRGHAQLLTFWDSRGALANFTASSTGKRLAKAFASLPMEKAFEFHDYFVTWESDDVAPPSRPKRTGCGCAA